MKEKMTHEILEATTENEIKLLYPVFKELRPHVYSIEEFLRLARILQDEGRHFLYIKDTIEGETEPRVVSVITYGILNSLYCYRYMYIFDVCTLSTAKKKGYAGALMDKTIEIAKNSKCNVITLDSGFGNGRSDAHRFYLRKGFYMKSHHFCFDISPVDKR